MMRLNPPLADWQGRRVWVVGASSGIGQALVDALLARGAQVVLSARRAEQLHAVAAGRPGAQVLPVDAADADGMRAAAQAAWQGGAIDLVVYGAGHYRAMRADAFDLEEAVRHWQVNYQGALHLLAATLPLLLAQGHGHLSLVASVAGYRGLPLSLAYGPTKAALIHLAQVLYMDLRPRGIGVSVVNPGFVRTPMTADNTFRMPALITPEEAAGQMLRGWAAGRFEIHFPRRFSAILKLLGLLPFGAYQAVVRRATGA